MLPHPNAQVAWTPNGWMTFLVAYAGEGYWALGANVDEAPDTHFGPRTQILSLHHGRDSARKQAKKCAATLGSAPWAGGRVERPIARHTKRAIDAKSTGYCPIGSGDRRVPPGTPLA